MNCRMQDLRFKDVVSVNDGTRIGSVCDVEIDTCTAKICAIVIYGRLRCFGIFGREDDIVINWCDIKLIGEDTILVNYCCPCKNKCDGLFGMFK